MNIYTEQDFRNDLEKALATMKSLGYAPETNHAIAIQFNGRLSRAMGRCRQYYCNVPNRRHFIIELNPLYTQTNERETVFVTVLHEVCHALPGCNNHGPIWQARFQAGLNLLGINQVAQRLNSHVSPAYFKALEEKRQAAQRKSFPSTPKYAVKCSHCRYQQFYQRNCATVRDIKNPTTQWMFKCPRCGTTNLHVENL